MKIFGLNIQLDRTSNMSEKMPKKANIRGTIKHENQIYRIRQDIQKWRNAVQTAESVYNPSRRLLYQTYKDVVVDAHLSGALQQRLLNAANSGWEICNKDGSINQEKTELLSKPWFQKYLNWAEESIFWGFSLVQLNDLIDFDFPQIELIPRQYVRPEFGTVTQYEAGTIGESYYDDKYYDWVIPIGDKRDLGLLMKAAPLVIWKKNTLGSWNEHAEIFGSPIRIGKTDVRDEITRKNMEDMLKNMGSSPWAVFDKEDNIELIEASSRDVYRIYGNLVEFLNKEISKLILGQTMTLDDGSSRSQAEIHERVAKQIEQADKEFLQADVQSNLFPRLNAHGFGLENMYFKFVEKDTLTMDAQSKFDIELIKSGKFKINPEYITEKYGTTIDEVVEEEPNESGQKFIENQAGRISNLYSHV